ncbi:plasmid replication/partition related protein [Acidovorax sp. NCPPB 4044]|uniref:plasmid replication/partition related protein n=1 Tax=Acidovorax sp. NCPPB 4044 TaxID=2940490 RepID=UPI0023049E53|nr:plasmid replication/partition related protein [Acidovorax sp. NCPPB 4044]MDA8522387.1 plasmid replication/partition related protein [Acidovorax sp. NCPPB 4044]
MSIIVKEELKAYIDPLTPEEHAALERSLLAEGCRDALVLWGDVLVDGHNRYGICQKHGLPFNTMQHPHFRSMEDVHLWMIDQHLGRRSVSDFQRGVLALRKREILAQRSVAPADTAAAGDDAPWESPADASGDGAPAAVAAPPQDGTPGTEPLTSREAIARAARLSSSQVVMIEKIQKQAAPELVAAVRSGSISINAAAAVATLPEDEQRAAALAGKDELRQAAKRARDARRKPRAEAPAEAPISEDSAAGNEGAEAPDDVPALRRRVAELTAENEALRQEVARLRASSAS